MLRGPGPVLGGGGGPKGPPGMGFLPGLGGLGGLGRDLAMGGPPGSEFRESLRRCEGAGVCWFGGRAQGQ